MKLSFFNFRRFEWLQRNNICIRTNFQRKNTHNGGGHQRPEQAGYHPEDCERHIQPHLFHGGES